MLTAFWLLLQTRVVLVAEKAPKANAYCERLIGTIRRGCLDFLIPINERHLRRLVKVFLTPLQPRPPTLRVRARNPAEPPQAKVPAGPHRHKFPAGYRIASTPVLGGLHHEYRLEKEAA